MCLKLIPDTYELPQGVGREASLHKLRLARRVCIAGVEIPRDSLRVLKNALRSGDVAQLQLGQLGNLGMRLKPRIVVPSRLNRPKA